MKHKLVLLYQPLFPVCLSHCLTKVGYFLIRHRQQFSPSDSSLSFEEISRKAIGGLSIKYWYSPLPTLKATDEELGSKKKDTICLCVWNGIIKSTSLATLFPWSVNILNFLGRISTKKCQKEILGICRRKHIYHKNLREKMRSYILSVRRKTSLLMLTSLSCYFLRN